MISILQRIIARASQVLPDKSIEASKAEWNELAGENARYYIVSKKGTGIQEDQFKETGGENYKELILDDTVLRERLGDFSDKRVLDIGCGVGRLSEFFAGDFARVDGVDIAERMIEQARARLAHVPNAHFTATDGMHYPFPDESFDLVFSYIVFQHMPSLAVVEENLREVRRVLKPSGIAKIQLRGGPIPRKGTWFYGPTFSKETAAALLKKVGLRPLKMGDDSVKRFLLWLEK